ncbi:MAG: GLUG motif-containing protein, partial [Planctomycetota bacterium]
MGRISVIGLSVTVFLLISSPSQAKYSGGTGEPNEPYRIATANDLNDIGNHTEDWGSHFVLTDDIDLTGYSESNFNLIGADWQSYFSGVFDGNGHTISNFTYTFSGPYNMGLFRYVYGGSAEIRDLTLVDPNIDAGTGNTAGALIGRMSNGATLSNCHVRGGYIWANYGNGAIGGLAGFNMGSISDCSAQVTVTGYGNTGGTVGIGCLVGSNRGLISNCYAVGRVDGNDYWVGGLVGDNSDDGVISHCYASATVEGGHDVGGFVGANSGTIYDCNATGSVSGTWATGGFVGFNWSTIERCHARTGVTGDYEVGGFAGASYMGSISGCYATGDVVGGISGAD